MFLLTINATSITGVTSYVSSHTGLVSAVILYGVIGMVCFKVFITLMEKYGKRLTGH